MILAIAATITSIYCHKKEQEFLEKFDETGAQRAHAGKWVCGGIAAASVVAALVSGIHLYLYRTEPTESLSPVTHDTHDTHETHETPDPNARKQQLKDAIERDIDTLTTLVLATKTFETSLQKNKAKVLDAKAHFEQEAKGACGRENRQVIANCMQRLQLELERIKIGEKHARLCKEGLRKKRPQIGRMLETITANITEYQTVADDVDAIDQNEIVQEIREYLGLPKL